MKKYQDAYGQTMYDYLQGKGGVEIIERDDGYFNASGGPAYYLSEYKNWPARQKKAIHYAKGKVLDIGCGAGRHSLYLQEKGLDVLGIDNSPLAIKVCKLRGLRKTRIMSITQISPKLGQFETILMLGNNFGLLANFKRAKVLLKRFCTMTTPRARIIAESYDPHQTDDPIHLAYHKLNKSRGRMAGQVRIRIRYKKSVTLWFDYLLVSKDEMQQILGGTGWKVKRFIDVNAGRYTSIIEKQNCESD
jgi:trans-aconitate methyltransferase